MTVCTACQVQRGNTQQLPLFRELTRAPSLLVHAQGLVNKLTDYGVPEGNILGIRYGFKCVLCLRLRFLKEGLHSISSAGGCCLDRSLLGVQNLF